MTDYKVLFTEAVWSHLALVELWESSASLELLSENNDIFEAAGKYRFKKKTPQIDIPTRVCIRISFIFFLRALARTDL